ncbi:hypothetical protein [Pseudomonas sp. A014]|uniref:hypothetical protein n=1 Tax=Pseudomonas sp. A014 TaxID=3458058 RepID=UPI004036BA43
MHILLTSHQQYVIATAMSYLDSSLGATNTLGVLLVGKPGVGMSTCIEQIKNCTTRKYLNLHAIDSHSGHGLGGWLSNTFGLDDVRCTMNLRVSPALTKMLEIIGISLLVLEDAHDVNSPGHRARALDKILEEFARLKDKVSSMKLLMTIQAAEMSGAKYNESELSKLFDIIFVRPMSHEDLLLFIQEVYYKDIEALARPVLSERAIYAISEFSNGSIGRALFLIDVMKRHLKSFQNNGWGEGDIVEFISRFQR